MKYSYPHVLSAIVPHYVIVKLLWIWHYIWDSHIL